MNKSISLQKTGALYIRVSTHDQEELSPDAQIRLGLEFAQKNNIYVPNDYIFRDDGISGRKADKRPEFQKLIALAKSPEHPIDSIIVWKFSRFARNQEESIVYKSLLQKNKVNVLSISEPLIEGPFGTLIERIIEWMDEYYSINLSTEVVRGMTENAMNGNYQSDAPIGYLSPGDKNPPVKDPKTYPIIEYCDKWFMEDKMTPRQIAFELNKRGYCTKRGNNFDTRGIEYILQNPFYAGKNRWNYTDRGRVLKPADEVIYTDGNWEPAWSWEHYLEMQARLNELKAANKNKGRRSKRDVSSNSHWLSGMLFCSSCGGSLASGGTVKAKSFQCWRYGKALCTESHYISADTAANSVIAGLRMLLNSDQLSYTLEKATPDDDFLHEQELNDLLNRLDTRENRAKEAYLNGVDTINEYKQIRSQIEQERSRLKEELANLHIKAIPDKSTTDAMMVNNIIDALDILEDASADHVKKSLAIRGIVDKIIFDRKNMNMDIFLKLIL